MRSVRGVIFTDVCTPELARSVENAAHEKVIGYFRPTAALIETLETRLRPALRLAQKKPGTLYRLSADAERRAEEEWGVRGALAEILPQLDAFRRQYVGIVVQGGARRVLLNCFTDLAGDGRDEFPDWTERFIDHVDDGGPSFWRIQYDIASGRFLGFDWNPSG